MQQNEVFSTVRLGAEVIQSSEEDRLAQLWKRIFAVDPSLRSSGWALFSVEGERPIGMGTITSLPAKYSLEYRLDDLQSRIRALYERISLSASDIVVVEAPTTMKDPLAVVKVERVRGIFEVLAREMDASVPGRIHPRTVQRTFFSARGKQVKREEVKQSARIVVNQLFKVELEEFGLSGEAALKKHQDIVDALLVGGVALSKIRHCQTGGVELEEVFHVAR